jgi:heme/copper-type cytochrome/quinol oxidase subunit 1
MMVFAMPPLTVATLLLALDRYLASISSRMPPAAI